MKGHTKVVVTALAALLALSILAPASASAALQVIPGSFRAYASNSLDPVNEWVGNPADLDTQAGSHPFITTVAFGFESVETPPQFPGGPPGRAPGGNLRNLSLDLPAGLIGNPNAAPLCPRATFEHRSAAGEGSCPAASQIGTAVVDLGGEELEYRPVFDIEAPLDKPALLGFTVESVAVYLEPNVRSDGDYGLRVRSAEVSQQLPVISSEVSIWGVPADPRHNPQRFHEGSFGFELSAPRKPFLTNPSDCQEQAPTSILRVESWQQAGFSSPVSAVSPPVEGCDDLGFSPTLALSPGASGLDSPTDATTTIEVPQNESPVGTGTPPVKTVSVLLPTGLTISPSAANGLGSCTDQQLGYGTLAPAACPDDSKVGSATVRTPLLKQPLKGAAYIGQPLSRVPGSGQMYRLFIALEGSGVTVKLRGEVRPDPATGQLSVSFPDNPQVPFEELKLNLFGGPSAALATPPSCGAFSTGTTIGAWSGQVVAGMNGFTVNAGCSQAGRFAPALDAGTINPVAGASSPFVFNLSRADGELDPSGVSVTLPEGLTGVLRGVPYCPDAALAAASSRTAAQELASPSCSAVSRIGTATVGAGSGSSPFYVNGAVYLAGPYKGAPLSIAVLVPAAAGPYDLGVVAVRAAVVVDPTTTQLRVQSDPLPQILAGVPLRLRSVQISIDRDHFMQNPTSCRRQEVKGNFLGLPSVTGAGSGVPTSYAPSVPFQVGNCASLGFKPKLALSLSGAKTRRGGYPALKATLTTRKGDANIGRAAVTLPKTEFLEQAHIRTVCTRVQYAANACPAKSIYGYAKAWTPLLDKPLEGPVYLRSSSNKLPDLVASLDGQIHVDLDGRIDSVNARIRNTFDFVPDAPVSKFVLEMKGGSKGLLVNNTNICKAQPQAEANFDGQNGKTEDLTPLAMVSNCGKKGKEK